MHKRVYARLALLLSSLCFLIVLIFSTVLQNIPVQANSLSINGVSTQKSGGTSRQDMIEHAKMWTSIHMQYSQTAPYYPDATNGYRRDSSGFVSMAWGISPGLIAKAPHGLTTEELYVISDPVQRTSQLQPGDVLLNLDRADHFNHAVIFNGWTDANGHPVTYDAHKPPTYYDGLEENANQPYGYAVEHVIPYPYYKDYGASNYMAQRFDATKASNLDYIPNRPGGKWVQSSPQNGGTITGDMLHLAAAAYPTRKTDPAIATVYFTIEMNGMQIIVCAPTEPSMDGDVYTCDVNLKKSGFSAGQMQVSFNVVDAENNVNLASEGVHTFTYNPTNSTAPVAGSSTTPTPQPTQSGQPQPGQPQPGQPGQPQPAPTSAPKPVPTAAAPPPTPAPPPPTPAPAPPQPAICASAPSDGNCTGQDPVVGRCSGDAYNVTISYIKGSNGGNIGEVDLRYSKTCQSNWGRLVVYSSCGHSHLIANVTRPAQTYGGRSFGYAQEPYTINSPSCQSNFEMYTNMVYATGTIKAQACGNIDSYTGCTILT